MVMAYENTVLLIDKTTGVTSFDTVSVVKRLIGQKKIGHCGTLDLFASGLLVLCTGYATKLVQHLMESSKTYRAVIAFGRQTDTDDALGKEISVGSFVGIDVGDIRQVASNFLGEQMQQPPVFSALKINGRRASDLARSGKAAALAPRRVFINEIALRSYAPETGLLEIDVTCSKGTYIRALARDIGERLGCKAYCAELRRLACGELSVNDAVTTDELAADINGVDTTKEFCLSPSRALVGYGRVVLNGIGERRALNGGIFAKEDVIEMRHGNKGGYIIFDEKENLIAIANIDIETWQIKYFNVFNNSQRV